MSTALEKAAEYSPGQLLLLSMLTGGAGFGGMRLLNDLTNSVSPLKPADNSIKLQLANPHAQQSKHNQHDMSGVDSASQPQLPAFNKGAEDVGFAAPGSPPWWLPVAAVGAGIPAGFMGTKMLYDKYQENQHQQNIEKAKQDYTKQLMLAQQMNKLSEATPYLDNLCEVMAEEFEKTAAMNPAAKLGLGALGLGSAAVVGSNELSKHPTWMGSKPPVIPGISETQIVDNLSKDPEARQAAVDTVANNGLSGVWNAINKFTGNSPNAVKQGWQGLAGVGAVGMLALLLNNHTKKKEKEMKANYPTSINYAPQ